MEYPRGKRRETGIIEFEASIDINKYLDNICPYCLGSGKLKIMQSAMTYDAGSVRLSDAKVKCNYCNGKGFKSN